MTRLEEITKYINISIEEIKDNKIQNMLNSLRPKRKFLDKIKNKDITLDEYNNILKNIINILFQELINKYPFIKYKDNSTASKLANILITFYNYRFSTHFSNNKAKIYPISLDEETAENLYKNEIQAITREHLVTGKNYEDLIKEKIKIYQKKIEFYKDTLHEIEIEPYYGTPKFMYNHALFINECLKRLPFKTDNQDKLLEEMRDFIEKYPEIKSDISPNSYPYFNKDYKTDYKNFETKYVELLNYEESLVPLTAEIWQKYLTPPKEHNNDSFKYLIHTFTNGLVAPGEMTKACCSLATEKLLSTPHGNCGLIYKFTPESIEAICNEDAKSWIVHKSEFIERNIPLSWQLTNNNLFFENPNISKLILPSELEKYSIATNLIHNKELLNYTNFQSYTEILLNSNAKAIGVFYTDNCQNIEEIKAYAKKYNLPLVHLSLKKLRVQTNLNPIPTKNRPEKEASSVLRY